MKEPPNFTEALLGWEPRVTFVDGLHDTIDWYFAEKSRLSNLEQKLLEPRAVSLATL